MTPPPVAYDTAEPDAITDDEAAVVLLHVLEHLAETLTGPDESHVVRCCGCGSWAWDERPCRVCATLRGRARRRCTTR